MARAKTATGRLAVEAGGRGSKPAKRELFEPPCEALMCRNVGCWGYGEPGQFSAARRWYCQEHKAEGEAWWRATYFGGLSR